MCVPLADLRDGGGFGAGVRVSAVIYQPTISRCVPTVYHAARAKPREGFGQSGLRSAHSYSQGFQGWSLDKVFGGKLDTACMMIARPLLLPIHHFMNSFLRWDQSHGNQDILLRKLGCDRIALRDTVSGLLAYVLKLVQV